MPSDEIAKQVQAATDYAGQRDLVVDQLLRIYAEQSTGDLAQVERVFQLVRKRYAGNRKFRRAMNVRATIELRNGCPTLTRPRVTVANLGDGVLPPERAQQ
jgi:hypothetical protein